MTIFELREWIESISALWILAPFAAIGIAWLIKWWWNSQKDG